MAILDFPVAREVDMAGSSNRITTVISTLAIATVILTAALGLAACSTLHQSPHDPPKFSSVIRTLNTDLAKIRGDLRRERRDASAGAAGPGEPACYNLVNNVNFDVLKTIDNFAQSTVSSDVTNLQNDIDTLRSDVRSYQADLADFINDGVRSPTGSNGEIREIHHRIRQVVARANRIIKGLQAAISSAYKIADHLAVGHCSSDKPEAQTAEPTIPRVQ
jgi:outer membrane murein-binding lipoprotein Lpp